MQSFQEWLSLHVVKSPGKVILAAVALFNLLFFAAGAITLSLLAPSDLPVHGFWASLFYTVSMVLDAGCVSYVVQDVGQTGVAVIIACMIIVLVGMVTFTGCVIGYITNWISSFIENANDGGRKLYASNHTVILNWNNRSAEIINDLMYSDRRELVVVLVNDRYERVQEEIRNRLAETVRLENKTIAEKCPYPQHSLRRSLYMHHHGFRGAATVIVRQGDTFSEKQLLDISLDKAKSIMIMNRTAGVVTREDRIQQTGNPLTIKTLVLVAEIASADSSADNQKIIVETEDEWTYKLAQKVILQKEVLKKCHIIAVPINRVLGQLLSQFSITPDLNRVYSTLLSNKGAAFYSMPVEQLEERGNEAFLETHRWAIPLTEMDTVYGRQLFFMAEHAGAALRAEAHPVEPELPPVEVNPDYWLPRRNVLILGHNSKLQSIMEGFGAFRAEWNPALDGRDILNVGVIDCAESLALLNRYEEYPYVNPDLITEAALYEKEKIIAAVDRFIDGQDGDTGILILSDDTAEEYMQDAAAMTYLIYVESLLAERRSRCGGKDTERVDVIVEIINPKNYDVVRSYSVDNVVISNRYISKMVTQVGEKESLYEFYTDILTYDTDAAADAYESCELYLKRAGDYLTRMPGVTTAEALIRAIPAAARRADPDSRTMVLGYVRPDGEMILFGGNQSRIEVDLQPEDRLIVFSNH